MKKLFFISIAIAVLAAFFASANPDGLDSVSEKLGFAGKGVERTAPMTDYSIGFLPKGGVSTAVAGTAGVLITLAVFWLAISVLKIRQKNKKTAMFLSVIFLMLFSLPSFAARPLVTDDFGTVDTGKYEFETGYNAITPKTGGQTISGIVAQIKRGMSPSFDIGIEMPYTMGTPSGFGDAVVHAKLKLKEIGDGEGLSFRADLKLSNGDAVQGLGSGFLDYGGLFIFSKDLSGVKSHFNAGYAVIGDVLNSCDDDAFIYGAAFEKDIVDGVNIGAEYTGVSCRIRNSGNMQVAVRWQAFENVRFDAGYSIAMNDNSSNISTVGVTAEF